MSSIGAKVEELLNNSPFIKKADDASKNWAKNAAFEDVENFVAEIEDYNKCFDAGLDSEPKFGKSLKGSKKFDTPPYYAIQIFPLARKNFGGVKTDLRCRVLNKYFEPIPGLYAAGEVAGMAGGHINGKAGLEGTMLGPSVFSGRVAGAWAANEAGFGPGFIGKAKPAGAGLKISNRSRVKVQRFWLRNPGLNLELLNFEQRPKRPSCYNWRT